MGNYASCLLIVAGRADALATFDLPSALQVESPGATMEIEHVSTAKAEVAAFTFETKYAAPVGWILMLSGEHPDLRFVLEWVDDIFEHCGHTWFCKGETPLSIYLNYNGKNFGPGQLFRGWITDDLVWIVEGLDAKLDWELVGAVEHALMPEMEPPGQLKVEKRPRPAGCVSDEHDPSWWERRDGTWNCEDCHPTF